MPDAWPDRCVGYLHLSAGYDGTARDAAGRGWLVDALPGLHLDLVRRPDAVTAALRQLVARLVADRPAT